MNTRSGCPSSTHYGNTLLCAILFKKSPNVMSAYGHNTQLSVEKTKWHVILPSKEDNNIATQMCIKLDGLLCLKYSPITTLAVL